MRQALAVWLCGLLLLQGTRAVAEDKEAKTVEESAFTVTVDLDAARASVLGGKVFEYIRKTAKAELGEIVDNGAITRLLGLDPFQDIHAATVMGNYFDHPEKGLQVVLSLGKNAGNLEGVAVTLPEYEYFDHGEHRVHSAKIDATLQTFGAVHTDKQGMKRVVGTTERNEATRLLDALDGKEGTTALRLQPSNGAYLEVRLTKTPVDFREEPQIANIFKVIQSATLSVGEQNDELQLKVVLTAVDERSAEQFKQLTQSLSGLVELAQLSDEDADLKSAARLLEKMAVSREGTQIQLQWALPMELALRLIGKQELGL